MKFNSHTGDKRTSDASKQKKAVLSLLRLHGLCGERKALWGNAPMCLKRR